MKARLEQITADAVDTAHRSHLAVERLAAEPEYQRAQVLMLFLSMNTELDTTPLALRAWNDHKRVLAPRVAWSQRRLTPTEIRSISSDVRTNNHGLREPIQGPPFPIGDIDLVVVPGIAFDRHGNRLGRGKGFFDRFLANERLRAIICGLAFEDQVLPELPVDAHDMPVDMLVTDQQVHRFTRPARPRSQ